METQKLTNLQKAIEIVEEVKGINEQVRKETPTVDVRAGATYYSYGEVQLCFYVFVGSELVESMYLYEFNESKIKNFEQFREHLMNDICGKSAQEVVRYYKMKQLEKLEAELAENGE